jgi:hypothetical protein
VVVREIKQEMLVQHGHGFSQLLCLASQALDARFRVSKQLLIVLGSDNSNSHSNDQNHEPRSTQKPQTSSAVMMWRRFLDMLRACGTP